MIELQRQLALDPVRIPEPPAEDRSLWQIARRLGAVTGLAALVAWGMVALTGPRNIPRETAQVDTPPPRPTANQVKLLHFVAPTILAPLVPDQTAGTSPPSSQAAPLPAPTTASAPIVEAIPATPGSNSSMPGDDETTTLITRGQTLLQSGDLVSARLILRRPAETGSASAALALGATFDPLVIRRLGVIGIEPDAERARQWYQKAAELGSAEAAQQLAKLEQGH